MIHELLLALSGYPGSIFTWNKRSGLQVSQDFPFLHPSETSVLNRLCRLGTDYIRFTEFIEQYTGHVQQQDHHPSQQGQGGSHGIYLRAFCTGLDSVLQPYRQALLDLEQEFLADPHLSISHVNYSLDQFQPVVADHAGVFTGTGRLRAFPGPIYGWERRRGCKHHHFLS